ncbi:MAG: hypothetical protein U9N81_06855 [Bacillota bacterium]|nr:hypothetical protein [Bacillota bacterium]
MQKSARSMKIVREAKESYHQSTYQRTVLSKRAHAVSVHSSVKGKTRGGTTKLAK